MASFKRSTLWVITAALSAAVLPSEAQVRVIDSTPVTPASVPSQPVTNTVSNSGSELYNRLELLQQEVQELRGLVEQQTFEIKRLKQQRLDDYTDLDQRISVLLQGNSNTPAASLGNATDSDASSAIDNNSAVATGEEIPEERELYRQAIDLLLKQKDFNGSAELLEQYLNYYPQGLFAPNAQYWLGEIRLSNGDTEASKTWFTKLITQYPGHAKIPDAKFKLGKIYFEQGDTIKAKQLLTEVANGGSSAADLARNYLSANQI